MRGTKKFKLYSDTQINDANISNEACNALIVRSPIFGILKERLKINKEEVRDGIPTKLLQEGQEIQMLVRQHEPKQREQGNHHAHQQ